MKRIFLTAAILIFPIASNAQLINEAGIDPLAANCGALLPGLRDPGLLNSKATLSFEAFVRGAALGTASKKTILEGFETTCEADPSLSIYDAMRRTVRTYVK